MFAYKVAPYFILLTYAVPDLFNSKPRKVDHYSLESDSLVVRVSASGLEGRWFAPRPRNTKGSKNGTGSSQKKG